MDGGALVYVSKNILFFIFIASVSIARAMLHNGEYKRSAGLQGTSLSIYHTIY